MNNTKRRALAQRLRTIFTGYWIDFFAGDDNFRVVIVLEITNLAEAILFNFAKERKITPTKSRAGGIYIEQKIREYRNHLNINATDCEEGKNLLRKLINGNIQAVFNENPNPILEEYLREIFQRFNFSRKDILYQLEEEKDDISKNVASKFQEIDELLRETFRNKHTHDIELGIPSKDTVDSALRLLLEFITIINPEYKQFLENSKELLKVKNHWDFYNAIQQSKDLILSVKKKEETKTIEIVKYKKSQKVYEPKTITYRDDRTIWEIIEYIEEGKWR